MFSHKIIEDLKKSLPRFKKEKMYTAVIENVIDMLDISFKFHMGGVDTLIDLMPKSIYGGFMFESGMEKIHLPYDITYFDYIDDLNLYPKKATLCVESMFDKEFMMVYNFCYMKEEDLWLLIPIEQVVHLGNRLSKLDLAEKISLAFPGSSIDENNFDGDTLHNHTSAYLLEDHTHLESFVKIQDKASTCLHCYLMLLNCKNIGTNKITAPQKLNKKRSKSGKAPLYDYHILKLEIPGEQKVTRNITHEEAINNYRRHFCRGHIRIYTSEKPLFGKYVGRVWISSHLRGSESQGFSDKDYSV